eukprot:746867-Hanusia_phi.AAC.1
MSTSEAQTPPPAAERSFGSLPAVRPAEAVKSPHHVSVCFIAAAHAPDSSEEEQAEATQASHPMVVIVT